MVGAILRIVRLDTFPPGLYADVAFNGVDALGVPAHGLQAIYPRGAGRGIEGMIVWVDAVSVALVGARPIALYVTTVVIGLVTLPVHYLLGSRLFGRRVGLISTALLAVSFWAVHYSRLGYRTLLVPLFLDLAFLLLLWAVRRGSTWRWGLAGGVLGLGAYTYTSYRLVALAIAGLVILRILAGREIPGDRSSWAVFVVTAAAVAAPLAIATVLQPDVLGRGADVSILKEGSLAGLPGRLIDHAWRTIVAFNLWGDPESQYNVPHLPLFDPIVGLAFLAGIVVAVKRWRESRYALLLLWLGIFTLVVVLSDRTPHMLRASGLVPAGKQYRSITLEADGRHLLTDVWTSIGVLVGVAAVAITGVERLDPVIALVVAANIVWTGIGLVRRSMLGLLDTALPPEQRDAVQAVLTRYERDYGIRTHAFRTRQAGARRFVSVHVIVPGGWTVHQGHELLEKLEREIRTALPSVTVFTHLESLEDPASWEDATLDRDDATST